MWVDAGLNTQLLNIIPEAKCLCAEQICMPYHPSAVRGSAVLSSGAVWTRLQRPGRQAGAWQTPLDVAVHKTLYTSTLSSDRAVKQARGRTV